MTDQPSNQAANQAANALRSNAIGLIGAATLGVVMLSPAMTLYGAFGPSFLTAGKAAPLAFVWALIATIPTAICYALLSSEHPDSGSAASWAAKALPRRIATWAGWMVFFYYFTNFAIQPVTMGVFLSDALTSFGFHSGIGTYVLGAIICCGWAASIVYRGIAISTKGALAFLLVESSVVVALCLSIVFLGARNHGIHLSLEGFSVTASPTGTSGLFKAMVFSMLAYCGFDVVSTLAEETKLARKLIPQATLLSLVVFAGFIIAGIWCLSYGETPERIRDFAEKGQMPINLIAQTYWGKGAVLVMITAISAALGLAIATAVGSSRVLYWMGREGFASPRLAVLDDRFRVPRFAFHLIFVGGVLGAIMSGFLMGAYQSYVWWCSTSTFFAMITYIFVNLSCLILNWRKAFSTVVAFLLYVVIPISGLALDAYLLFRSFFVELWGQGWANGQSVIVFDLVAAGIVAVLVIWPKKAQEKCLGFGT